MTKIVPQTSSKPRGRQVRTTLLDVVTAISDVAASDAEAVAVAYHMLVSGRVRQLRCADPNNEAA